jgi:Neprosin/Neprosin activation peptide
MDSGRDPFAFQAFYKSLGTARHEEYKHRLKTRVVNRAAFEEQRQHLLGLYADLEVKHSFVDEHGQTFDCVPRERQPALTHAGLELATPPALPGSTPNAPSAARPAVSACPPGTVPIRRITLDELTRFETLDHFKRKNAETPRLAGQPLRTAVPTLAGETHEYAHAAQNVDNVGGRSTLSVWAPAVGPGQIFSLSQQWYVGYLGNGGVQTIEVGWQVFPQKYGHDSPVLFTYWTRDDYQQTGAYNNEDNDFVQYSSNLPVGAALANVSAPGGAVAELELSYFLSAGNWWLFVNDEPIGYYPGTLYADGPLASGASRVDFGGETVGQTRYPQMGSGIFADQPGAAYQRNISYFTSNGVASDVDLVASQDWPASYTVRLGGSPEWGQYLYFGGPGGPAAAAALSARRAEDEATRVVQLATAALRAAGASASAFPNGVGVVQLELAGGARDEASIRIRFTGAASPAPGDRGAE